jgi:hypothetical protein
MKMDAGEKVINNTVKKLYVDDAGMVPFLCPHCGDSRKRSMDKYRDVPGLIKMSCTCGYTSAVQLEFRKFFRKDTELEGLYYRTILEGHWGKMIVRNLSLTGCGFEMFRKEPLAVGEKIKLEFTLDNPRRSLIRKNAVVSEIGGNHVGCRFVDSPGSIDTELGFYLRKH